MTDRGRTDDKIRLGRLWTNTSQAGAKYMSGWTSAQTLDDAIDLLRRGGRLLVLSNTNKRPDKKDPDADLYVTPPWEEDGR